MASRSALLSLMTGAAIASLSTAALADGWNSLIIFGGRDYDSGQYVSSEAIFPDGSDVGDGRQRATNNVTGNTRGRVGSQRIAGALGFGEPTPSQPQSYGSIQTPPDGLNYAATFYTSAEILDSIVGTARTSTINYRDADGVNVSVKGRERPGFLNDPDRRNGAWGALVLVGSSQRDLRLTADIDRGLDKIVDLSDSFIVLDPTVRDRIATDAAANIATGVEALTAAKAGLVVVSNAYDAGRIPEVVGDNGMLAEASTLLAERETEAQTAETSARSAQTIADNSAVIAQSAASQLARITGQRDALLNDPDASATALESLTQQVATAQTNADSTSEQAAARALSAQEARAEATRLALTQFEIDQRIQIDAAIADPLLIGNTRTAATDLYNATLLQRLRGIDGNLVLIDQRALFDAVIDDPARFGLSTNINHANECLDDGLLFPCNVVTVAADELLFVNGVELTETGHQLAADQITALLTAPATLSAVPAIGISAGRGIADAARDQVSREQTSTPGIAPFIAGVGSRVQLDNTANRIPKQDAGYYSGVAGVKYVFVPGIAVGVAGGYQKLTNPNDDPALKQEGTGLFGTVFAGINTGPVFGSVTATYGNLDYSDLNRVSKIGAARIRNTGDTEGTVSGITAEAGLRLLERDILRAGPIANVSHWRSEVDGYAESGWQATAVSTGDVEMESTRAGIGLFMEAGNIVDGHGSVFRVKALYGHEFGDETRTASVTPLGATSVGSFSTEVRGVDKAPLEFGAEVVLGYRGVLTTFGYDGIMGDVSDHRFRVGASMPL